MKTLFNEIMAIRRRAKKTPYGFLRLKEIWIMVFQYLDAQNITKCMALNTQIRQLCNVNLIWRRFVHVIEENFLEMGNYQHITIKNIIF